MINNNGVKKSAAEVTNGISKLLGSCPRLKRIIALTNRMINIVKNNNREPTIYIVISKFKTSPKGNGLITALVPRTKKMLNILEPTTLTIAISDLPL